MTVWKEVTVSDVFDNGNKLGKKFIIVFSVLFKNNAPVHRRYWLLEC